MSCGHVLGIRTYRFIYTDGLCLHMDAGENNTVKLHNKLLPIYHLSALAQLDQFQEKV